MTFGLPSWLKSRYKELNYEVPVWYPLGDQPDYREWIVANELGGYSSSTISDTHTRRYHAVLVAAMHEPVDRHIILSRIQEQVSLNGHSYELGTDHWASGVVSPTGYKFIEAFALLPAPTWVYNMDGHYLIKQLTLARKTNTVHIGYCWLPDHERSGGKATLLIRFFTGFRDFHSQTYGSVDKCCNQSVSGKQSHLWLENSPLCMQLSWTDGIYEQQSQWWWAYHWPEEAARGMPDQEDLILSGNLRAVLEPGGELSVAASLGADVKSPECRLVIESNLAYQNQLLHTAALPRSPETNLLVLACDQFLVGRSNAEIAGTSVIAGYPWLNDAGREAMIALTGLTISTRRFDEARKILRLFASLVKDGVMANRFLDNAAEPEYTSVDTTLWWAWSLYNYYQSTKDLDFIREQYPLLLQAAQCYQQGTTHGIQMDPVDGLLSCGDPQLELTWMDAVVESMPITPRAGKPVEICALWYNLLATSCYFASELSVQSAALESLLPLTCASMQKFWNAEHQCLYDVIEQLGHSSAKPEAAIRPNQLLAISLPFRAFTKEQEKLILSVVERELLTPAGIRSLSPADASYQSHYGCGFSCADEYHRNLSLHQGSAWPWLVGAYCDALINVHGQHVETFTRIRATLQPLLKHLVEEGCIGSISEVFDGSAPHAPHSCFAHAPAVAEVMRSAARALRS